MRAKTINEVQKFERGLDPKVAMDIGGISLVDVYIDTVVNAKQKWNKYLETFIGKTVSVCPDHSKYVSKLYSEEDRITIIVHDIGSDTNGAVHIRSRKDGSNWYIDIEKKIYIIK